MNVEEEKEFVGELKRYVGENLPLSEMEDSELESRIEELVSVKMGDR